MNISFTTPSRAQITVDGVSLSFDAQETAKEAIRIVFNNRKIVVTPGNDGLLDVSVGTVPDMDKLCLSDCETMTCRSGGETLIPSESVQEAGEPEKADAAGTGSEHPETEAESEESGEKPSDAETHIVQPASDVHHISREEEDEIIRCLLNNDF